MYLRRVLSYLVTGALLSTLTVANIFAQGDFKVESKPMVSLVQKTVDIEMIKRKLETAQNSLLWANQDLQKVQGQVDVAIEKAKAKHAKSIEDAAKKESKLQATLDKDTLQDTKQKEKITSDFTKEKEKQLKLETDLQKKLSEIDATLAKDLATIDKKISETTDELLKQKYATAKTDLQNTSISNKAVINKYLLAIKLIWPDTEKAYNLNLDILTRRQAADSEYLKNITANSKIELTARAGLEQEKTDAQIESEVRAKYQKRIDRLNATILKLQTNIAEWTEIVGQQ